MIAVVSMEEKLSWSDTHEHLRGVLSSHERSSTFVFSTYYHLTIYFKKDARLFESVANAHRKFSMMSMPFRKPMPSELAFILSPNPSV